MKWNLAAGFLTIFLVETHVVPPADACGVKLTIKSSAPRKAVARTSNPSDVLLLGNPPRRLELDLAASGHRVEVAPRASAAKRKSYAVVITDSELQDEARSSFNGAVVVVRSGNLTADIRFVENQVGRKPVRTDQSREVVAARGGRTPIAAGPARDPSRRIVAASEPRDVPIVPGSPPAPATQPERVAASVPRATRPPVAEPRETGTTPEAEPKPRTAVKANTVPHEVYFTLGRSKVSGQATSSLARAVRWLTDSRDISVIIEGHADPTGTPEGNMLLAQQRAEWVRDYLVSAGIDESRLEVISYGDTRLRYSRTDPRNRRVAIVVK